MELLKNRGNIEFLYSLYRSIANHRLHVLLTTIGVTIMITVIEGMPVAVGPVSAVVGIIYGSYILNTILDKKEDTINYGGSYQLFWKYPNISMLLVALLIGFGVIYSAKVSMQAGIIALSAAVTASLYSIPCLWVGKRGLRRIKDIPIVKNIVCSTVWGVSVVLLTHAILGVPLTETSWSLFCLLVLMNYYIEVLWDLRDVIGDRQSKYMVTLPMMLGNKRTIYYLQLLNILITVTTIMFIIKGFIPEIFYVYVLLGVANIRFIHQYLDGDTKLKSHVYVMMNAVTIIILTAVYSKYFTQ